MPRETEIKIRLNDAGALRERLEQVGGEFVGRVFETNRIFDTPDRSLFSRDCALRVRENRARSDEPIRSSTLTWKGPRIAGELVRSREEIELEIADAQAATALLARLGFRERIVYEKRRETWRLDHCEIVLDELPRLGTFVEIEAADESRVLAARRELQLDRLPVEHETYVALAAEQGDRGDNGSRSLTFSATPPTMS